MNVKGHSYCTSAKSITFACLQHRQHAYSEYVKCLGAGVSKNIRKQTRSDLKKFMSCCARSPTRISRAARRHRMDRNTEQKLTQLNINDWQRFDKTHACRNPNTAPRKALRVYNQRLSDVDVCASLSTRCTNFHYVLHVSVQDESLQYIWVCSLHTAVLYDVECSVMLYSDVNCAFFLFFFLLVAWKRAASLTTFLLLYNKMTE